jgi:hypothetical protein
MASRKVDDPSIENSGNNLKAVEVDYRKNSDDSNTMVYFYRTKEDALAAAPDPATRSFTVRDTSTSPGSASAETREAMWTAMPFTSLSTCSISPVWRPLRT